MLNTPPPYNPLDRVELGKSVERALLSQPLVPLPPSSSFPGAGIYALYYIGEFEAYRPITPPVRKVGEVPIYVGRAVPRGSRAGGEGLRATTPEPVLFRRLREHAGSIRKVEDCAEKAGRPNIRLGEFLCRFLVVEDIWVALGEAVLIGHYLPVWNGVVQGFGIHSPGGGRKAQARSDWDALHPGRSFAAGRPTGLRSVTEIMTMINLHLDRTSIPDLNASPDPDVVEQLMLSEDGGSAEDYPENDS